ncbi:hypothetical protein HPB47_016933, partial [Ixodes persulcatus]
ANPLLLYMQILLWLPTLATPLGKKHHDLAGSTRVQRFEQVISSATHDPPVQHGRQDYSSERTPSARHLASKFLSGPLVTRATSSTAYKNRHLHDTYFSGLGGTP